MDVTVNEEKCHLLVAGEPCMTLAEAMTRLRISRKTAYRWINKGKLTRVRHNGRVYCLVDQIIRLEVEQEQEARDARR